MEILILDAYNANTLAIVRHLGQKGYAIHLAGNARRNIAFYSKYVSGKFILPDAKKEEEKFKAELLNLVQQQKFDVLLPVGFKTFSICAELQTQLNAFVKTLLPPVESIHIASNKYLTYSLAEKLGVPYPKTIKINAVEEVEALQNLSFPLVIKSQLELGKTIVAYAHTKEELVTKYKKMVGEFNFKAPFLPIIQEFITGEGYGFFALYVNGICQNYFMHHRIREYPPSGGISTCAESYRDEQLKEFSCRLLNELKWNGVAMVEFKKQGNGEYRLMEINPKFWGSLELSMTAGVNFPELIIQALNGRASTEAGKYKQIRFQWLMNGELFHFFEKPSSFLKIFGDLFRSKNDFWLRDIKPTALQFVNIFYHLYKKIKA